MNELECNCNYIEDTVEKIDRMQKRVIIDDSNTCIFCETSLFTSTNNTIPVAFYTKCGNAVEGLNGACGSTTQYFRIESIRCKRYVTLRLLSCDTSTTPSSLTATEYTMILDLDCVGQMQCFPPISVTLCNQTINEFKK